MVSRRVSSAYFNVLPLTRIAHLPRRRRRILSGGGCHFYARTLYKYPGGLATVHVRKQVGWNRWWNGSPPLLAEGEAHVRGSASPDFAAPAGASNPGADGKVFCADAIPMEQAIMKRSEVLQKLEERLARGEISEKTYLEIKARYETEPEERSVTEEPAPFGPGLESSIQQAVARAQQEASRAAKDAMSVAGEAMRSIDFAGFGAKVSGESIRLMGYGMVSGIPVMTIEFRAAGSDHVRGNLECESARDSGACDFDRDVRCVEFPADSIKGQDLDLECTTADYVEGQDVRIGPHCRVDLVVAQDLVVHESSEVKERRVQSG